MKRITNAFLNVFFRITKKSGSSKTMKRQIYDFSIIHMNYL